MEAILKRGDAASLPRNLVEVPARFVVITDGERGAWFIDRAATEALDFVPSFKVTAVEPTGAGDAFGAALVSRLIAREWGGLSADDVRFASAAGALATTKPGAMEALPTRAEIEAFLARRTS